LIDELDALLSNREISLLVHGCTAIQRQVVSGWYVLSWKTVTGPAVTLRSSNQRTPATIRRTNGVIADQRFVVAEIAIRETEHQTVTNAINSIRLCQAGHATTGFAPHSTREASRRLTSEKSKVEFARCGEVDVKWNTRYEPRPGNSTKRCGAPGR